ncbi:MAG TPA: hypothetical protein VMY34_03710, partial [Acidimicrobiales bacterium]|nr:hypothetical protein [Acidimicrobiales bacterium]
MTDLVWHDGLPDVRVGIEGCGHVMRWARGELEHEDVVAAAEQVLGALGGEACRCAGFVQAWTDHRHDLAVLALAPRNERDHLVAAADVVGRFGEACCVREVEQLRRSIPTPPRLADKERAVHRWMGGLLLMAMPWDILHRLQATV